jgi:hypothetical protein
MNRASVLECGSPLPLFHCVLQSSTDGKWQSIFDANADGIPDVRRIEGEDKRQLFLGGKCYSYEVSGTNNIIDFNGKPVPFFFDGSSWRENTNLTGKPTSSPNSERIDKETELAGRP